MGQSDSQLDADEVKEKQHIHKVSDSEKHYGHGISMTL